MTARTITLADVPQNQRQGYDYRRLVSQDTDRYNVLHIVVYDTHAPRRVLHGIRNYYVLAGIGTFTVENCQYAVAAGTLLVINPGEVYSYAGEMELLEFNIPTDGKIEHEDIG